MTTCIVGPVKQNGKDVTLIGDDFRDGGYFDFPFASHPAGNESSGSVNQPPMRCKQKAQTRQCPLQMTGKRTASTCECQDKASQNRSRLATDLETEKNKDTNPTSAVSNGMHHAIRGSNSGVRPAGIWGTSPPFIQTSASHMELGKTSGPTKTWATTQRPLSQSTQKTWRPIVSNRVSNTALARSVKQLPNDGILRYIRTSFVHPIDFAYKPPLDGSKPCHWCRDFTYGLLGLGEREVEVIDYRDGMGYVEASGGHVSQGREPSRMCMICALERLQIIGCRSHIVAPLDGWDESTFDLDRAFDSLEPAPGEDHCTKKNHWCSLCTNPAFYGCIAFRQVSNLQEPTQSSSVDSIGCGLLLCGNCARMMGKCGGSLARTIKAIKLTSVELRADSEFLLPSGDLYQTYKRKFRQRSGSGVSRACVVSAVMYNTTTI
jgi:hypothetical protein